MSMEVLSQEAPSELQNQLDITRDTYVTRIIVSVKRSGEIVPSVKDVTWIRYGFFQYQNVPYRLKMTRVLHFWLYLW